MPIRIGDVELLVGTSPVTGSEPTSTVDVIGQLSESAVRPEQAEVTFGLQFSAQGNVVLAGVSGEATLEVTLRYGTVGGD